MQTPYSPSSWKIKQIKCVSPLLVQKRLLLNVKNPEYVRNAAICSMPSPTRFIKIAWSPSLLIRLSARSMSNACHQKIDLGGKSNEKGLSWFFSVFRRTHIAGVESEPLFYLWSSDYDLDIYGQCIIYLGFVEEYSLKNDGMHVYKGVEAWVKM